MTTEFAVGHYFRLINDDDAVVLRLQNFFISETVSHDGGGYQFSPFGFSGLSTNRQADLEPVTLAFPNNEISRGYLSDALRGLSFDGRPIDERPWRRPYIGKVDVCLLDVEAKTTTTRLFTYTGQCSAGGRDDTTLQLELSSVLDAVDGDVPTRTLVSRQVGSLPITSSVRLN